MRQQKHRITLGKGKRSRISIVLCVRLKKGSHLDNGKRLPGVVVDEDVANVRRIRC
jgi:hypothetical protein